MKIRKKPVVVDGVQILATDYNGINWDALPFSEYPDWLQEAIETLQVVPVRNRETDYAEWRIITLEDGSKGEAKHIAGPGDWIIRGIQGELYFCKPDIFEQTYEIVK